MKSGTGTARRPMTLKPLVEGDRCLRAGIGKSTCTRCRDVCPAAGFRLQSHGIALPESCWGCHFCTAECPAGALKGPLPPRSILQKEQVAIRCSQCGGPKGVQVPCIGAVPASLLGRLAAKRIPVTVYTGDCKRCPMQEGLALFQRRLADLGDPSWKPVITQGNGGMDHPRRALFATLGRAVTGGFHAATDYDAAMSSSRWRPVFTEHCTGCPVCESACPREALVREKTEDHVTYYVDTAACNGCRKCVESCMLNGVRLAHIDNGEHAPEVASYRFSRKRCKVCGTWFATAKLSVCPRCRKDGRGMNLRLRIGGNSGVPIRMESHRK